MKRILVTGGGGFLGQAICQQLLQKNYNVRIYNRNRYPEVEALGIASITGDITDRSKLMAAMQDCDAVIHTAAKAGVWGSWQEYERINVGGTRTVIDCCRRQGIRDLVYTSSPSVVFDGRSQRGIDETYPYPKTFTAAYPATKAKAEQMVRQATGDNLRTVSLRPHLIWGPGDNHLAPRIIERAKAGRLRLIGSKPQLIDAVYIENAAAAHVIALEGLDRYPERINGKVFFITNFEPWMTDRMINRILAVAGLPPVEKRVPKALASSLSVPIEAAYRLFHKTTEPPLTKFMVQQLASSHWYSNENAKNLLGYQPSISMEEGFRRLQHSWQRAGNSAMTASYLQQLSTTVLPH